MIHIGFTGTQRGMTLAQRNALRRLLAKIKGETFHHNDRVGADEEAHGVAIGEGYRIHLHPPTRDRELTDVVHATECLIAAPGEAAEQTCSGTWLLVRHARNLGRPVYLILPDGTVA